MKTLKDLFLEELADRFDSEKQLVQAMPKLAEAATCSHFKKLIQTHLKQTEGHVTKLEGIFKTFGETPHTKKCQGTVGLIKEGEEIASHFKGSPAINAALVSAAQKIEHYEIASYGCLQEWAKCLDHDEAAKVLKGILDEEIEANKTLTELARTRSNQEAMGSESTPGKHAEVKNGHKSAAAAM
jgi:ferritin-like metal-binding protein YciE